MFAVIYSFKVRPGLEGQFLTAWSEMTKLIKLHEKGLGSRLHRQNEQTYIAYAQWPDRKTWLHAGKNLPEDANLVRKAMREACEEIETTHELEVIKDLLAGSDETL